MSDNPNPSPAEAAELLTGLFAQAGNLPPPTQEDLNRREYERQKASLDLLVETRKRNSVGRFDVACPPDMRESDWAHPRLKPWRKQIDAILNHQADGNRGILAYGPSGRGKSRAMWALMHRLCCVEYRDVRMWTASQWFGSLQDQVKYGNDDARGWVEATAKRPLCFIDDFGQEALLTSRSEWALSWFFQFLDIRLGAKLPFYMTTNLSSRDLSLRRGNVRGDPFVRRLLDLCDVVTFQ